MSSRTEGARAGRDRWRWALVATAVGVGFAPIPPAGAGSQGATERVSVSSSGSQSTSVGGITTPTISDDGRYVTYHTRSTGLVPNDTNDREEIGRAHV